MTVLARAISNLTDRPYRQDFQSSEIVKYDHEPPRLGTRNDCAGEGQQQFTS
jgi:hypothetical protein